MKQQCEVDKCNLHFYLTFLFFTHTSIYNIGKRNKKQSIRNQEKKLIDLEVSVSCPLNIEHGAEHNFLCAAVSTTPYSLFDNEIAHHLLFTVVLVFLRVKRETKFFLLLCLLKIGKIKAKQWGWGCRTWADFFVK